MCEIQLFYDIAKYGLVIPARVCPYEQSECFP